MKSGTTGGGPKGYGMRRPLSLHGITVTGEQRLLPAIESPRQLEEVMVDFWFNHFIVVR